MINTKKDRPDFGLECNKLLKKKKLFNFLSAERIICYCLTPVTKRHF